MQQPLSFPDEPEELSHLSESDVPAELAPEPLTLPVTPGSDEPPDNDASGIETRGPWQEPESSTPYPFPGATTDTADAHTSSQRELLLEQYRQRVRGEDETSNDPDATHDDSALPNDPAGIEPTSTGAAASPSGGVSQRETILRQQREILLRQAGVSPQAAQQTQNDRRSDDQGTSHRTWLTRRSAWATLVISLSLLLLAGGAAASGQGGALEQVATALAPDVVERWINERVSSFGADSATPSAAIGAVDITNPNSVGRTETPASATQLLRARIANTNGAGVSVRGICVREARSPELLDEGTAVRVIGRGVGDCSGWSVVRAGGKTSWVEDHFLAAAATP